MARVTCARNGAGPAAASAPGRGAARLARLGVFSIVTLGLAVLAHSLAAPELARPGRAAVALGALPVVVCALVLSARRCRFPTLLLALGCLQGLLHRLFEAVPDPAPAGGGAGHVAHTLVAARQLAPVGDWAQQTGSHAHGATSPLMVALHLAATAATAGVMAQGERLLWMLARRLTPALPGAPAAAPVGARLPGAASVVLARPRHLADSLRVRGPPVAALSARAARAVLS